MKESKNDFSSHFVMPISSIMGVYMFNIVNLIEKAISLINNIVWGPVMVFMLVGSGIYFTYRLRFMQITKIKFITQKTIFSIFKCKSNGSDISPFQAMTTALAGTIGTGNIVGTATAIAIGGPGSLFWMIVSSVFGMMTKYSEIVLSIIYRKKNGNIYSGGPMYYIEKGLNKKWLAKCFCIFAFFSTFGIGNIAQVNAISTAFYNSFNLNKIVTGIIVAILIAFVIIGDAKRIAKTTEKLVPIMSVFFIAVCFYVLYVNRANVLSSVKLVFLYAFNPNSAIGGFAGSTLSFTIRKGLSSGVFTNEAGLGSAPIAHAMSNTKSPVEQGVWGIFEVFIDTVLVCSLTGLAILSSNVWDSGLVGIELTIKAFSTALGSLSSYTLAISIFFFAFSSIVSWSYYGKVCLEYLTNTDKFSDLYKILFICIIVVGSNANAMFALDLSEALNGLMAIPNLIAVISMSGIVISTTNNYFNKKR